MSSRRSGTVYDPELDEPITSLGFVASCDVSAGGDVDVRLRLPTPQCAPNFAYLMAADARAAVRAVPGVRRRRRSCSRTTTRARRSTPPSDAATGFAQAFPGETEGELTRCASCSSARRWSPASRACARRCWRRARPPARSSRCASPTCRTTATPCAAWSCGGARHARVRRAGVRRRRRRADRGRRAARWLRRARLVGRASRPTAASAARCCASATASTTEEVAA